MYFKEAKRTKDRSKGDSTTSEEQLSSSGPRSIIKKSAVPDSGLRVSFHDTTVGGELAPVIEGESISHESSSANNTTSSSGNSTNIANGATNSKSNTTNVVNSKTNNATVNKCASPQAIPNNEYLTPSQANERFTPSTDESIQTEDDSVFASIGSIGSDSPPASHLAPRIKITSENNDVFYIENEGASGDIDESATKKSRDYFRSVSEQPQSAEAVNVNTNANSVPRSTSDNCLNKNESESGKRRSRVSKSRSFFRWFNRRRAWSPKSSPESSKSSEEGSRKFLAFPRHSHPRSYSDGGEDTKGNNSMFSDGDNLTKVKSDTLIYNNESNQKKSWFSKLGNKQAKSDSHILEEQNQQQNKPKLQSYPSVERLDRIPSKRRKSKRRKKRQLKKNLNSNTEESWLEDSTVIDVDNSTYSSNGLLNRSLSDPCISIQELEDKVQFQEDIKRQRSFRRGKKTSSTCNPDVQSIYLILDNFESQRSSDV